MSKCEHSNHGYICWEPAYLKQIAALEARCATLTAEVIHYTAGTPHPLEARCREAEARVPLKGGIPLAQYVLQQRIAELEAALVESQEWNWSDPATIPGEVHEQMLKAMNPLVAASTSETP